MADKLRSLAYKANRQASQGLQHVSSSFKAILTWIDGMNYATAKGFEQWSHELGNESPCAWILG